MSNKKEKEDENVIEMINEFINSDDKTGPKINDSLAELVNLGLRKRVNGEKVKDLTKKYEKPANVTSLKVPIVNHGDHKNY